MSKIGIDQKLTHQKDYFNKIAKTYHKFSEQHIESIIKFNNATKKYISGKVLDIGSGGIIGYSLTNIEHLTLTDIASETLKNPLILKNGSLVSTDSKTISKITANVLKLPFKKETYNTVIMITTAHHLTDPSLTRT